MRFFLIFILNLLLIGCARKDSTFNSSTASKSQLVREINKKVFRQLKEEKNLYLFECGGGGADQIKFLHCGFIYYNEIDIKKARELLFTAGKQFLDAFNADERIHPYFEICPLKPENIQVEIFLKKSDGSELGSETLHVLAMTKGILKYKIESSETGLLKTIFTETYEEAAAKLSEAYKVHEEYQ